MEKNKLQMEDLNPYQSNVALHSTVQLRCARTNVKLKLMLLPSSG